MKELKTVKGLGLTITFHDGEKFKWDLDQKDEIHEMVTEMIDEANVKAEQESKRFKFRPKPKVLRGHRIKLTKTGRKKLSVKK